MKLLLSSILQGTFAAAKSRFPKPVEECRVVCIPTAANVYAEEKKSWLYEEMDAVRAAGATLDVFDIAGKSSREVAEKIASADILYVTGGNCYTLVEHMQKCDFALALKPFFAKGGVYVGASAGTVACCPRVDFIGEMDDASQANLTSMQALNLVPFLVMVHTDHSKFAPMAKALMEQVPAKETIIGLTDSQALWIINNTVELIQV